MQETDGREVAVGEGLAVSVGVSVCRVGNASVEVNVAVGMFNGSVGGAWVGVVDGGRVSAMAREIPPSTKMTETIAIMTPLPS